MAVGVLGILLSWSQIYMPGAGIASILCLAAACFTLKGF